MHEKRNKGIHITHFPIYHTTNSEQTILLCPFFSYPTSSPLPFLILPLLSLNIRPQPIEPPPKKPSSPALSYRISLSSSSHHITSHHIITHLSCVNSLQLYVSQLQTYSDVKTFQTPFASHTPPLPPLSPHPSPASLPLPAI